jgi:hypothetical protein
VQELQGPSALVTFEVDRLNLVTLPGVRDKFDSNIGRGQARIKFASLADRNALIEFTVEYERGQ